MLVWCRLVSLHTLQVITRVCFQYKMPCLVDACSPACSWACLCWHVPAWICLLLFAFFDRHHCTNRQCKTPRCACNLALCQHLGGACCVSPCFDQTVGQAVIESWTSMLRIPFAGSTAILITSFDKYDGKMLLLQVRTRRDFELLGGVPNHLNIFALACLVSLSMTHL